MDGYTHMLAQKNKKNPKIMNSHLIWLYIYHANEHLFTLSLSVAFFFSVLFTFSHIFSLRRSAIGCYPCGFVKLKFMHAFVCVWERACKFT